MERSNRWPYELYRGKFRIRDRLDRKTFRIKKNVRARVNSSPPFSQYNNYAEYNYTILDSHGKYSSKCYFENGSRGNFKFPPYYGVKIEEINEMLQSQIEKRSNGNTTLMSVPTVDGWTEDQVDLVKKTVAPGATNDELKMFLAVSSKFRLDPLAREIFFWKDKSGKVCIFTGIDGWKKAAMQDPNFSGIKSAVVKAGDDFSMDAESGIVKHTITAKRGEIVGAWAIAYHKDPVMPPAVEWCDFEDYKKPIGAWLTNPCDMIKKTAETHALRKQFSLTGLDLRGDVSDEDRYNQIKQQLTEPRISPEKKMHRVRVGKLLRSFHSIGVTTEMIEQYLGMAIDDIGDQEINEISEIGKDIVSGRGTWQQVIAPFGINAIDIQAQPPQSQAQGLNHLPNMDGQPWAGERFNQGSQHQSAVVENGKERLLRSKIKGKLEAIFPKNPDDQNGWLDDHFSTDFDKLDTLNIETLQPILDAVEKLFEGRPAQQ